MDMVSEADRALIRHRMADWVEIQQIMRRLNKSTSDNPLDWHVGPEDVGALIGALLVLIDPTMHGIQVSREYLQTVHRILGIV